MPETPAPPPSQSLPPETPRRSVLEIIRAINKRIDKYPAKVADFLKWSHKSIIGLEIGFFLAGGFLAVQVTEWAAAIAFWFALGFVLLIKSLSWRGFDGRKVLTGFSRAVLCIGAITLAVLLCVWTTLKKPPDQVWTAFQNFHKKGASSTQTEALPLLHITKMQVSFNRQNENQIIANIFIQSDSGDAEMSTYNSNTLAINTSPSEDAAHLEGMWKSADDLRKTQTAPEFTIHSKEGRWFTNFGQTYSNDQIALFNQGKGTFYFLGYIVAREGTITQTVPYCGYVTGLDLTAIVQCEQPKEGRNSTATPPKLPVLNTPQVVLRKKQPPKTAKSAPCPGGYSIIEDATASKSEWDHAKTTGFVFNGVDPCLKIEGAKSIDNDVGYQFNKAKPEKLAPTYEQKCENSACAQGPGSQATYNGPPKPIISWEQDKIDNSTAGQYSARIVIHIKNDMPYPAFEAVCDRACSTDGDEGPTYPNRQGSFWGMGGGTGDPRIVKFAYSTPPMMPDGTTLEWWIRSADGKPIKILNVFDPLLKR